MTMPAGISPFYIAFLALGGTYNLLKDKIFAKGDQTVKVETVAQSVFPTIPQTVLAAGAGYVAGQAGAAAAQAATCPAPALLLGAPAAAGAGAAGGAAGAASGGFYSSFSDAAYGAAGKAANFAWSQLSWSTIIAAGGVGMLGLAYAVYQLFNKSSGVNVNVTNNNKIVFEVPAHTRVVQKTDADGTLRLSLQDHQALVQMIKAHSAEENERLAEIVRQILEDEAGRPAAAPSV